LDNRGLEELQSIEAEDYGTTGSGVAEFLEDVPGEM
jgi:hypothetical protein